MNQQVKLTILPQTPLYIIIQSIIQHYNLLTMETYEDYMNIQSFHNQPKLFDSFVLDYPCSFQEKKSYFSNQNEFDITNFDILQVPYKSYSNEGKNLFLNFDTIQDEQSTMKSRKKLLGLDRQKKNQTKNIPKNYGKAIISYILKSKKNTSKILLMNHTNSEEFYQYLTDTSKSINTISDLRNLWNNEKYGKSLRILSYQFMRKHSLSYIFKSRIRNYLTHIKYREKIMQGIKNPQCFNNIKDY